MIGCLPTQSLAFLAVFVYATQRNASDCVWMETGLQLYVITSSSSPSAAGASSWLACRNMSNHGRCCEWNVRWFSRCRSLQVDRTRASHTSDQTPEAPWICPTRHTDRTSYSGKPSSFQWQWSIQGGAKNRAILSHCKYSENSVTELRRNIANVFLLTYSL